MISGLIDGTLAIITIPPCLHRAAGVHLPLHPLGDILVEDLWVKCWKLSTGNWRMQPENSIISCMILISPTETGIASGATSLGRNPRRHVKCRIWHLPFQNSWAGSSLPKLPWKAMTCRVSKLGGCKPKRIILKRNTNSNMSS